jgi:hypothetical protein
MVMNHIHKASLHSQRDVQGVISQASNLQVPSDRNFSKLFHKGKDILTSLAMFYRFPTWKETLIHPSLLTRLLPVTWGVVSPFVRSGFNLLMYLSSDIPPPPDGAHPSHDDVGRSLLPSTHTSVDVADVILRRSNDAWLSVSEADRTFFGTDTSEWKGAFQAYADALQASINTHVSESLSTSTLSPQQASVLKALPQKLRHLLHSACVDCFKGPGQLPLIHGGIPIMCPDFFVFLANLSLRIDSMLSFVRSLNPLRPCPIHLTCFCFNAADFSYLYAWHDCICQVRLQQL